MMLTASLTQAFCHDLMMLIWRPAALRRDRVVGPILQLKDELFQTFESDFATPGQVRHWSP